MKCKRLRAPIRISTRRLLLKAPSLSDAQSVQDSWKLDGKRISMPEAIAQIEKILLNHERNAVGAFTHLCLAVVEKESGKYVGWCGLAHDEKAMSGPVIYCQLRKAYQGRGYGTEAATAVLDFGFRKLGLQQIDGNCPADNAAARRIMEKIGMRYLGFDPKGSHVFTLRIEEYRESFPTRSF